MFLLDTNIFLEILLQQEKRSACKVFIQKHLEHISISDFSLHSIGVITFRQHKPNLFQLFTADLLSHIQVLSLPVPLYAEFESLSSGLHLDFDDAYQYLLAKQFHLIKQRIIGFIENRLATMDNPKQTGKPLQGTLSEYWAYRVGGYRILSKHQDDQLLILIVEIGHRKEVYK